MTNGACLSGERTVSATPCVQDLGGRCFRPVSLAVLAQAATENVAILALDPLSHPGGGREGWAEGGDEQDVGNAAMYSRQAMECQEYKTCRPFQPLAADPIAQGNRT